MAPMEVPEEALEDTRACKDAAARKTTTELIAERTSKVMAKETMSNLTIFKENMFTGGKGGLNTENVKGDKWTSGRGAGGILLKGHGLLLRTELHRSIRPKGAKDTEQVEAAADGF